jgi:hypothetical protein
MQRFAFLISALLIASVLAFSGRDATALVVVFVGFLSLGRAALLPVLATASVLIASGIMLLIWYLPYWFFGKVPLRDFLEDWWFVYFFWVSTGIWGYWSMKRASEETWAILRENHSTQSEFLARRSSFEAERGFLSYDEEALPVDSVAVSTGIVLARPNGDALHIPWEKILELGHTRVAGQDQALLKLSRTFTVEVPWRPSFNSVLPDGLREST